MIGTWKSNNGGDVPVFIEKLVPDSPGSGLFLAHIRMLDDTHPGYPARVRLTIGAHPVEVEGVSLHEWGVKFKRTKEAYWRRDSEFRAAMESRFMNWLQQQVEMNNDRAI